VNDADWPRFAAALAPIAEIAPDRIRPDDRLVDEYGCDSVAIAEIAVLMTSEFDGAQALHRLDEAAWRQLTVGQLYDYDVQGRR